MGRRRGRKEYIHTEKKEQTTFKIIIPSSLLPAPGKKRSVQ
jgi:hypothetical protein